MIEKKHTPTPWCAQYNGHYWDITTAPEQYSPFLASVFRPENVRDGQANAEHIVRCVNAHDALVAALLDVMRRIADSDYWWMGSKDRGGFDVDMIEDALKGLTP